MEHPHVLANPRIVGRRERPFQIRRGLHPEPERHPREPDLCQRPGRAMQLVGLGEKLQRAGVVVKTTTLDALLDEKVYLTFSSEDGRAAQHKKPRSDDPGGSPPRSRSNRPPRTHVRALYHRRGPRKKLRTTADADAAETVAAPDLQGDQGRDCLRWPALKVIQTPLRPEMKEAGLPATSLLGRPCASGRLAAAFASGALRPAPGRREDGPVGERSPPPRPRIRRHDYCPQDVWGTRRLALPSRASRRDRIRRGFYRDRQPTQRTDLCAGRAAQLFNLFEEVVPRAIENLDTARASADLTFRSVGTFASGGDKFDCAKDRYRRGACLAR